MRAVDIIINKRDNKELSKEDLIIDAIFGIGLNARVEGIFYEVIDSVNKSKKKVLAVDIASGLDADSGNVLGISVKADSTITFASCKNGILKNKGKVYSGEIKVADISIPRQLLNRE